MRGLYLQTEVTQEQLAAVAASNPGVPERVLARVERDRSFIVHLLRSLLDDLRPDFRRRALFRGLEAMLAKAEAEGREIDVNAATAVEKSWTKGERRKLGRGSRRGGQPAEPDRRRRAQSRPRVAGTVYGPGDQGLGPPEIRPRAR